MIDVHEYIEKTQPNICQLGALKYTIPTVASTIIAAIVGQIFLRNFYRLLSFDEMFSGIFAQITNARMQSPILLLLIVSLLCVLAVIKLSRRKILAIAAATVLTLILLMVSILFTKVNGIFFGDVVRTLVPLLESGAI